MDYHELVKPLRTPDGWRPPTELSYQDVRATAITREHLEDDVRGINAGIDLILRTRGGGWPTEPVTAEYDYIDLVWHECEFREGYSFTYVLHDLDGRYLGCCYLYPMGRRTPLTEELLACDVDVSWWVTPDAYEHGYYTRVHAALHHWLDTAFPFRNPHYSNSEIPSPSDE
jgi:RimJ/RimL family protein N-acetyltransferase